MAETEQNKTEEPTPFKLKRAREKGQVARGTDLGFFAVLAGLSIYTLVVGAQLLGVLADAMRQILVTVGSSDSDPRNIMMALSAAPGRMFEAVALFAITIVLSVLLFEIIQVRGIAISAHPLKPDFSRLNPAKGLKRVFSMRMLKDTLKNVAKLAVYACTAFLIIQEGFHQAEPGVQDATSLVEALRASGTKLLFVFVLIALVFAAIDQVIVRREFLKQMRMSRSELTREIKDREGEPRIKRRRKQLHAEFAKQTKALGNLKGSDLLIVNPEHFAIALAYDSSTMSAPQVTAKGRNNFALLLKARARLLSIPIFELPLLARALYRKCDVGSEVPQDEYRAVVDIYLNISRSKARQAAAP
ncbi:MAG TPA: EscU/YscU/HrcU family type III secretion system export apparatus switch protein [Hyphomonadaceae bacterium]|nr:EscU/YscU/HrcU family type III secretion system export apparatus switch protein [Hyphomonadaceae bacterium]